MGGAASPWNSLEIAKIVVSAALPVAVALLGYLLNRSLKSYEQQLMISRTATEWRIKVYEEISLELNKIYCFYNYVGSWKELTPGDVTTSKRLCDHFMHISGFLWHEDTEKAYRQFVGAIFVENKGLGVDFRLRANQDMYRSGSPLWVDGWAERFVDRSDAIPRSEFAKYYGRLLIMIQRDVGLLREFQSS